MQLFITEQAKLYPDNIALRGLEITMSYADLYDAVSHQVFQWQSLLGNLRPVVALAVENHPAWVVLDLAALQCEFPLVPLPFFFSPAQWLHAMEDAGATLLITDQPELFAPILADKVTHHSQLEIAGKILTQMRLTPAHSASLPAGTAKITYTSGTTGQPKGVCLSVANMLKVAGSIARVTSLSKHDIHLNILPLATLLENVAGIYAPLLVGASCTLLPSGEVGLSGASGLNVQKLATMLKTTGAHTAIFTPELLQALVAYMETSGHRLEQLRFLAVGGAHVSPALLQRAQTLGIPVYEGYGLSECASVVAMNTPSHNKIGSVGKALPHIEIQFSGENEIIVTGNTYLGYVGQHHDQQHRLFTGDIGSMDEDGYLFITGRKKNIFITSYGRNVSPEWVERELKMSPYIAQAALFGEAKPWNVAVIVPRHHATKRQVDQSIQEINQQLPDYARVTDWISADSPFTPNNQLLTVNGRNRRDRILQLYQNQINALYEGNDA
ncbi:MAG: long-chain fatty acid--CoA ligase [Betaproteobacteria bacterium]|nr:long-chain fatty acid--CoA ligase [Betaproteobacteria bacterium]